MENNEEKKPGAESARIIELIARETETIITKACEAARLEAEQEMEKALREYEQKTRQIVLKIREEAKGRTAEIAGRLGEAIMTSIEKSSTEAVADAVSEFGKKAERLTQTLKETARKETGQLLAGTEGDVRRFATEDEALPAADRHRETEETADEANADFELEAEQNQTVIKEDEANKEAGQSNEEFERWLTH